MKSFCHAALLSTAVATLSAVMPQAIAVAAVTIDSVELVERTRVGRTTFEYTYRINATNNGPVALDDVTAYLGRRIIAPDPVDSGTIADPTGNMHTSIANGTILLDDVISLGTLAAGATVTSADTIKLQQDRSFLLDPSELFWEVGFRAVVTLTGVVTDRPIAFADVSVQVDRTESGRPIIESGRPIIESYSTTADGEGNYSIDVDFVSDPDFVDITGTGVNDLDFVAMRSIVGSAGSLLEEATEGAGRANKRGVASLQVDSSDVNALNVTHISTALATLATQVNNGQVFTNDAALASAQTLVNNEQLLISAAVMKTVIDNANVSLPPGIANTQQLLNDQAAFDAFLQMLQEDFPAELQTAIDETIDDLSVNYVPAEVPPLLYLSLVRENPLISDANVFTFDQNGTAMHIDGTGETTEADWSVNVDGHLVVNMYNAPANEFFATREVPPGSGNFEQVRVEGRISQARIVRIALGIASDQVLLGGTFTNSFPDHDGVLPDEISERSPAPEFAYLAFEPSGILPYTNAGLAGKTVELTYFHNANDSLEFDNNQGADLLTFNANGTGSTARKQFNFTWSVDAQGRLTIVFASGDSSEYVRYGQLDQGQVDLGVLIGRVGGSAIARDSLSVYAIAGTTLDVATLLDHKFRSGFSIVEPDPAASNGVPRFDFNFLDDGYGCRDAGYISEFEWLVNPQGYMELRRFFYPGGKEPPELFRQRSWQAVAVVPGELGPRYWVIENLDFDSSDPAFPTDPTQTPGRVNFYEDLGDISDNTPPVAVADSANADPGVQVFIDVLANDTDSEGDPIMLYYLSGSTLGGFLDYSYDIYGLVNGLLYTPPVGVSDAIDTFTYGIVDGSCGYGGFNDGVVTVTIGAPD